MAETSQSTPVWHGQCFGFENERAQWQAPRMVVQSHAEARPGYDSMDASEYVEVEETFRAKVKVLARLLRSAKRCIVYTGAGLSTAAGIGDYASQAPESVSGVGKPEAPAPLAASDGPEKVAFKSPFCAQPTPAHRVIVALHREGFVFRWVNQNHDGLPQKAGLPQQAINEIHGAWHAPDNPVVQMSGNLRGDLFQDLVDCEREADLSIAVGTSLCGMNADRVVTSVAARAAKGVTGNLGSVVIGLQRTVLDETATLRIFGRCDDVFAALAGELNLTVPSAPPEGEYFVPAALVGRAEEDYLFSDIPYNAAGELSSEAFSTLDLRDDVELVIPTGMHAGAVGVVDGFDREGNLRCRFRLKPKKGNLRAPVMLLLGRWWVQAAVDGSVAQLPVVNKPAESDNSLPAASLRSVVEEYGK
eukprot:TRINITY_DN50184_c0_g1_i1.p1 TRINITY_DN50184_c0_g1~~TRINITY_DN50184_c0_g1_i1.p1  ORF type:complete len:456 (+),score=91.55 TRINITY_DN50184_c0_g1_i1:119-1369(+)